jgi:proteasome lid subunit RPN8/RPN11
VVAGIAIPARVADEMLAQARAELPNEACGLLAGRLLADDGAEALTYYPARNAEASPLRYSVHPDDLVRIVFEIDEAGRDMVGIFHSHTRSPAIPSATDRRAAQYPGAFYVLATLADPTAPPERVLRAWRMHGGHAFEVPLRVGERT